MQYYLMLEDVIYGPYTLQDMQSFKLFPDTPVHLSSWPEDKWVNASELPELRKPKEKKDKILTLEEMQKILDRETTRGLLRPHIKINNGQIKIPTEKFVGGTKMLLVVTDKGDIWNHNNPYLEKYKEQVLVVCLGGEKATDKYECFVPSSLSNVEKRLSCEKRKSDDCKETADEKESLTIEQKRRILVARLKGGMPVSISSNNTTVQQYQYILNNPLYPAKDELCNKFKSYTDIVFLADSVESSLYPYQIARENLIFSQSSDYSIHLVAAVDSKKNNHNMLSDLSYVSSVAYYETDKVFMNFYNKNDRILSCSYDGDYIKDNLGEMIPYFLNFPHDRSGRYYFDFTSMSHKSIDEGVEMVEMQLPRIDGKEVCNMLRMKRIELAVANNIPFESEECPSTGACAGTCPKCDEEAEYLRKCLEKIPEEKRGYPQFDPRKEV